PYVANRTDQRGHLPTTAHLTSPFCARWSNAEPTASRAPTASLRDEHSSPLTQSTRRYVRQGRRGRRNTAHDRGHTVRLTCIRDVTSKPRGQTSIYLAGQWKLRRWLDTGFLGKRMRQFRDRLQFGLLA